MATIQTWHKIIGILLCALGSNGLALTKAGSSPLLKRPFTIRYALMDTREDIKYFIHVGLPSLVSSHCSVEANLAPALVAAEFIQVLPDYVIYTDNNTHVHTQRWKESIAEADRSRVRLINLDEDPKDSLRMAPFVALGVDDKNLVSIRRTLADADHLSSTTSRLLLGTDVTFLTEPLGFMGEASRLGAGQAIY
eukprot:6462887-Amphidinium_carterae.1